MKDFFKDRIYSYTWNVDWSKLMHTVLKPINRFRKYWNLF